MFATKIKSQTKAAGESAGPLAVQRSASAQALQSAIGNQAALRRLSRPGARPLQPKLAIGAVDDPLEHEADQVADQVMRMPDPHVSLAPAPPQLSRKCAACEEEDGKTVRPKATGAVDTAAGEAPGVVHETLRSSGQPLDTASRAFFEPRFGRDFSGIRIHTDAQAAQSAQSISALAYATGPHIVFGAGQYAPGTDAGKALLAHELAHSVQQAGGGSGGEVVSRRVGGVNCTAGQFGAPAAPREALETADQTGIDLATQMAQGLATDALAVRGGIPATPSATLQAYEDHFGLPTASGAGFLNRMTGVVRPTQEIALSEEVDVVSRRFALVARTMGQGLSYTCLGAGSLTLVGCSAGTCGDSDGFSCPGNSLVALCEHFWTNFDDTGRAQVLVHEGFHITLGNIGIGAILDATTPGAGRNFNIAGCYEALIADQTGDQTATCPAVPTP